MDNILLAATGTVSGGHLWSIRIIGIAVVAAFYYFVTVRPRVREKEKKKEMLTKMEVGDVVETTGGFYGVLIDVTDEDVIVEFGSNKNCRIPMRKTAIADVYKAENDV